MDAEPRTASLLALITPHSRKLVRLNASLPKLMSTQANSHSVVLLGSNEPLLLVEKCLLLNKALMRILAQCGHKCNGSGVTAVNVPIEQNVIIIQR